MAIHGNSTSEITEINQQFLADVQEGLSGEPKKLPSKYFYDATGDKLFVEIMNLPEYYLTNAEHEILREQTAQIIQSLNLDPLQEFELIELGAGDGTKTKEILYYLQNNSYNYSYRPVDISQHALDSLKGNLKEEMPGLRIKPLQGDYFDALSSIKGNDLPKVILFLGSNMGNMYDENAKKFMLQLSQQLEKGDKVFVGLDRIKAVEIVLPAYNDSQGVTAKFNLNLLTRINRELGANFQVGQFEHAPSYTEESGIARSALRSLTKQSVYLKTLDRHFNFSAGELVHTEISRKYNRSILESVLKDSGFSITKEFRDSKEFFSNWLLAK
jgi:L-histidine N-alpha-methyltransferase